MLAQVQAPTFVWGAAEWGTVAAIAVGVMVLLLVWGYRKAGTSLGVRALAAGLKGLGVAILAVCLMEPLFSGTRARPGANQFVVLVDNSRSMTLHDGGEASGKTRGEVLKAMLARPAQWPAHWLARLGQDFDLRQYAFDTQLRAMGDVEELPFDGAASNLGAALERVARRYQGRPLAGVLLLTDGGATDAEALERLVSRTGGGSATRPAAGAEARVKLPPVYPVLVGRDAPARDIDLERVAVTQTNFEDAPVTLAAQVTSSGYAGRSVVAQLVDEAGKTLETQKLKVDKEGPPLTARFRVRPEKQGVSFYRINVAAEGEAAALPATTAPATAPTTNPTTAPTSAPTTSVAAKGEPSPEATLANNTRLVAVDRGQGPYRVLYVAGRPNWEFKFLQRAVQEDPQVQLVGLIRIARREPKFTFLGRKGEETNPLFRGFKNTDKDQVEQYDQPVMVRIFPEDQKDTDELRGGFPKTAEELYKYHAVILGDVESEFFTQDQMQLLKEFVRQRGGGLMMLGGQESFKNGKFDRTPIGDLLPVYADEVPATPEGAKFRLSLTREGWLEPWVRLRSEEDAERVRLGGMPAFAIVNQIRGIKPGATVLARAEVVAGTPDADGEGLLRPGAAASAAVGAVGTVPALVEQRFGRGRVAALLVGDLWRWAIRRPPNVEEAKDDLPKAWRQTVRWLVAEVPKRVEVTIEPAARAEGDSAEEAGGDVGAGAVVLAVRVRDEKYEPLDNAAVTVRVTGPDGVTVDLTAEPSGRQAGLYESRFVARRDGGYRAHVAALAPDGSEVGGAEAGWTSDPAAEEFRDLRPNGALLERVARGTGGEVVQAQDLPKFVAGLPARHAEITEPYVRPVWHQPWVFLLAIACLTAEWGLRRWRGLP